MVSCCCSSASSRWAGVSSGWLDDAAWPVAALKAALVLFVQRSGSMGIVRPHVFSCDQPGAHRPARATASGTRSRRYWRWVAATAARACAPRLVELGLRAGQLGLELEDPAHPFEVQPGGGQLLDVAQPGQVGVGEAPAPAARPRRVQQALALVDAQRLRVHAGQLGRHRDHVDGAVRSSPSRLVDRHCHAHHPLTRPPLAAPPRSPRPATRRRPAARRSARSAPAPRSSPSGRPASRRCGRPAGTPRPRTRSTVPEGVPAGTFSVTLASRVGTVIVVPSAASGNVTGTVMVRLRPCGRTIGCLPTWTTT